MSPNKATRRSCKDVFHAFMVQSANYDSDLEIPCIAAETEMPAKLLPFSKALSRTDFDAWIHFYEDDVAFERLWNNPKKYLPTFKRHKGIIAPDFSLYRDMPLVMQYWNVYRSHAVAAWLQNNQIPVIANVRWGDERTYDACCAGVPKNATIAIGSHGCIKRLADREYFIQGLEHVVKELTPRTLVVYGAAPDAIFGTYKDAGINILQFDSETRATHRKGSNS